MWICFCFCLTLQTKKSRDSASYAIILHENYAGNEMKQIQLRFAVCFSFEENQRDRFLILRETVHVSLFWNANFHQNVKISNPVTGWPRREEMVSSAISKVLQKTEKRIFMIWRQSALRNNQIYVLRRKCNLAIKIRKKPRWFSSTAKQTPKPICICRVCCFVFTQNNWCGIPVTWSVLVWSYKNKNHIEYNMVRRFIYIFATR